MDMPNSVISGLAIALSSAFSAAFITHFLAMRKDREERRRERITSHLTEAYANLESAAGRDHLTQDQKRRFESSIAAIFLFGSKNAANEAYKFTSGVASQTGGDVKPLLKVLRNELRKELGLETHDIDIPIFRMSENGESR